MNLNEIVQENKMVLMYVLGRHCNVCKVIKPQLKTLVQETFPELLWHEVDASLNTEWVGQNQIFSIPTVIVYFEGKEFFRKSRNFSLAEVVDAIKRPYQLFIN